MFSQNLLPQQRREGEYLPCLSLSEVQKRDDRGLLVVRWVLRHDLFHSLVIIIGEVEEGFRRVVWCIFVLPFAIMGGFGMSGSRPKTSDASIEQAKVLTLGILDAET